MAYGQKNYADIQGINGKYRISQDKLGLLVGKKIYISSHGYAFYREWDKQDKKTRTVYLHRLITNAPNGMDVDHINGDKLDNRNENLRICSHAENIRNSRLSSNNTSGVTGVVWDKSRKSWQARIKYNYKNILIGRFTDIQEAIAARKDAEKKYFKEFTHA